MVLEPLPPGITGFSDPSKPLRAVDPKAFGAACRLAANMEHGRVENLDLNPLARSYYAATVRTRTDYVSVLCNSVYPFLAFVPPNSLGFTELAFVIPVNLASLFARLTEFQPLDADWLKTTPQPEMLTALAPVELKQLKYWRPRRTGDVIFNHWD